MPLRPLYHHSANLLLTSLPSYFAYVNPSYHIPIRSVWLPIILVMLLSLLNLANYTAFSVIIALGTFGLYQSYFIAIACILYTRLTSPLSAPWSLGRWGPLINGFALVYSAWVGVFMIFPNYLPVTVKDWGRDADSSLRSFAALGRMS